MKHRLVINVTEPSDEPELHPLLTAVIYGQDSAVAWFLDHGADITQEIYPRCLCRITRTCFLHTAICFRYASTAQLLISRGAPLEYSSYMSGPGYEIDKTNALLEASLNGLDTVVETLFKDHGMKLQRRRGAWYQDALACAAMLDENVSTIKTLVGLGAHVDGLHSEWNSSPLHTAIVGGNFAVAHTLLDLGAKIRSYEYDTDAELNSEGEEDEERMGSAIITVDVAPLHDAIASIASNGGPRGWRAERDRFMKRLIELGADINLELVGDYNLMDNPSPLDVAVAIGDTQDMAMLITAGAEVESRMLYILWQHFDRTAPENLAKVRLLLRHGARLDHPIQDGETMLQLAADQADSTHEMSELHEILLLSSPKSLSSDHLDEVLAVRLANHGWDASTVLVRHGARVSCGDKLFSIASSIAELLEYETGEEHLQDFDMYPDPGPHDCMGFIIDMGLSSEDQCFIFEDALRKRLPALAHLFLDRGLASRPEAAVFLPAYLMLAASWGNICLIKRLWQRVHEDLDATLCYLLVQQSIVEGNREAVSFFMEHGATPFQHLTPAQASRERQMRKDALAVQLAALRRLEPFAEASSAGLAVRREYRRTKLLAARHGVSEYAMTYMEPSLSPLQLAVKCGHLDTVSDLLEYVTPSDADAITTCGEIHIPCGLMRANEIRETVQKNGMIAGQIREGFC